MMRTTLHHGRWAALALVLAFGLTACFKSAGENLPPTPQDQVINQQIGDTPVLPPTFTPLVAASETPDELLPTVEEMTEPPTGIPTLAPPTETPAPTLFFSGSPTPTLTVTTAPIFAQATNTPLAQPPFATNTPQPSLTPLPPPVTNTPQPTNTPLPPFPTNTSPPTLTPVPTQPPPVFLTATFTPAWVTPLPPTPTYTPYYAPAAFNPNSMAFNPPQAESPQVQGQPQAESFQTQPQEAQPLGERTAPPELNGGQGGAAATEPPLEIAQGPTLTVNEMTATQIVLEFKMTQDASLGTFVPTPTPFGQPIVPTQPGGAVIVVITSVPTGVAGQCNEHLVSPGETLYRIAAIYNVTVPQIVQMNGIVNENLIEAGYMLRIPCPLPATPTPVAPVVTAVPGTGVVPGTNTYIIEPGDNLYRISLRFNVSMAELMRVNGLTSATMNMIYAGQTLYIPTTAVVGVTPTPAPGTDICSQPGVICVTETPGF